MSYTQFLRSQPGSIGAGTFNINEWRGEGTRFLTNFDSVQSMGWNAFNPSDYLALGNDPQLNFEHYMSNLNAPQAYQSWDNRGNTITSEPEIPNEVGSVVEGAEESSMFDSVISSVTSGLSSMSLDMPFNAAAAFTTMEKSTSYMDQSKQDYNNAMAYGHGIGYQSIAADKLADESTAALKYTSTSTILSTIAPPLGLAFSALASPSMFEGNENYTYDVTDTGGQVSNAQSSFSIDTI